MKPSLQFLRSSWVRFAPNNKAGTWMSLIQKHYAKWQGDPMRPVKVGMKDFSLVHSDWKPVQNKWCPTCTIGDGSDLAQRITCQNLLHKKSSNERRVPYLELVTSTS